MSHLRGSLWTTTVSARAVAALLCQASGTELESCTCVCVRVHPAFRAQAMTGSSMQFKHQKFRWRANLKADRNQLEKHRNRLPFKLMRHRAGPSPGDDDMSSRSPEVTRAVRSCWSAWTLKALKGSIFVVLCVVVTYAQAATVSPSPSATMTRTKSISTSTTCTGRCTGTRHPHP